VKLVRRALVILAPLAVASCNGKVTREECSQMLDRYLDMTIASEYEARELASLTPSEAHAAREMKKAIRKTEPSYRRVHEQCEAEISKKEYRCAMKAPTPETWQACID
jgi:hypothetical protein